MREKSNKSLFNDTFETAVSSRLPDHLEFSYYLYWDLVNVHQYPHVVKSWGELSISCKIFERHSRALYYIIDERAPEVKIYRLIGDLMPNRTFAAITERLQIPADEDQAMHWESAAAESIKDLHDYLAEMTSTD